MEWCVRGEARIGRRIFNFRWSELFQIYFREGCRFLWCQNVVGEYTNGGAGSVFRLLSKYCIYESMQKRLENLPSQSFVVLEKVPCIVFSSNYWRVCNQLRLLLITLRCAVVLQQFSFRFVSYMTSSWMFIMLHQQAYEIYVKINEKSVVRSTKLNWFK